MNAASQWGEQLSHMFCGSRHEGSHNLRHSVVTAVIVRGLLLLLLIGCVLRCSYCVSHIFVLHRELF